MDNSNIDDNENNSEITPEVNETEAPSDSSESLNNNEEIPQLGNGYNPRARSNREAFQRGLDDNYNDRIARNKATLAQARARSNQATKKTEDGEEKDKNFLDKAGDKANLLKNKASLLNSQIDSARAKAFQMMHPIEASTMIAKKRFKAWIIGFVTANSTVIIFFVVLVACLISLGIFDGNDLSTNTNPGGNYTYSIDGENISNLKVRLLRCEGYEPIPNEELIDFETYVIGVVSQENGNAPYEALKAQAIAARSYALTRAKEMGGAYGLSLKNEDGQWILQIRNCTNDQVFCNPYKGCWSKIRGGQTGKGINDADCTIYSGVTTNENYWNGSILSNDSVIIKAVTETQGEVLVDNDGKIVYTPYVSSNQQKWNSLANQGYDYFEILVEEYGSNVILDNPTYNPPEEEGDGISTGNYINPCPSYTRISSPFGYRIHPVDGTKKFHKGIDLAASKGAKVQAFDGGKVTKIKTNCEVGDGECGGGAGNYVVIDHGNGMLTRYYHLSKVLVKTGQNVSIGQLIGEVGNTGKSTGAHLHFGVQVNEEYVNPQNYYSFN